MTLPHEKSNNIRSFYQNLTKFLIGADQYHILLTPIQFFVKPVKSEIIGLQTQYFFLNAITFVKIKTSKFCIGVSWVLY
jgi:hypothetical protein